MSESARKGTAKAGETGVASPVLDGESHPALRGHFEGRVRERAAMGASSSNSTVGDGI